MANKDEKRTEDTKGKSCIAKGRPVGAGEEAKREPKAGSVKKGNMPKVSKHEIKMSEDKTQARADGTYKVAVQPDTGSPQMQVDESQTVAISKHLSENINKLKSGGAKEQQFSDEESHHVAVETQSIADGEMRPIARKTQPTAEEMRPIARKTQPTAEEMRPAARKTQPTAEEMQSVPEEQQSGAEEVQSIPEEVWPKTEGKQLNVENPQPTAETPQPMAGEPQLPEDKIQPSKEIPSASPQVPNPGPRQPQGPPPHPKADKSHTNSDKPRAVFTDPHEQSGTNNGPDGEAAQWPAGKKPLGQPSSRRKSSKSSKSRGKSVWVVLIILGIVALAVLCMQIYFRVYVRGFDSNKIIQGVTIGHMDVSGLTAGQAGEKLSSELSDRQKAVLTLELDDGSQGEVLVKSLGITAKNLDSAIKEAVEYGKKGSALECYRIMKRAKKNENKKDFPLQYELNKEDAPVVFKNALSMVMKFPQNAKMTQTDSGVAVVDGTAGELPDVDKTTKSIEEFLTDKWDGKNGQVKAYASHQEPKIKASDLKDINAVIGTFSTSYATEAYATAVNVESGTLHMNGALIKPGEEFSANDAAKPYIVENGYINAASNKGDMLGAPMGGGISQVSSTLYMATLYAELDVTKRTPNPLPVSYIKPSMDAAIAEGKDDLEFKNNMKTPIYIEGLLSNGQIIFHIYGKETRDPGRKLDFVSETTQESNPQGKHFVATPDAAGSYYTLSKAQPAVTARLWKIIYKDGQEQKREIVNTSQYAASKETIAVGTVSEDTAYSKRITEAIKTQDESAILNAIGKGQP